MLVGVSGGADSVGLLDVLLQAGYVCLAAHCNFHLRGEESNRDEQFVRELCTRLDVPLHVASFETESYAREHALSIEMAARELRYRWFGELAEELGCQAVAVAHHQNDQAETVLLNLLRGTGLRGLAGMRPKSPNAYSDNGIPIVRPLLCTTRDYIELSLRTKRKLSWVVDSTNTDTTIRRNALRAQLAQCTKKEIEDNVEIGIKEPYRVSYRSLTPKEEECSNLLVPVCLSASHIAYGSIRMEPVFMVLGQSAALAACQAIDQCGGIIQRVDVTKVYSRMENSVK